MSGCKNENCTKSAGFNFPGKSKRIFCLTHKEDGMINVKSRKCQYLDCKISRVFNFEGEKIPIYCSSHKEEGMINIVTKSSD